MQDDINMQVTQPFEKDGKRYAFVRFTDEKGRSAEGRIPECKILSSDGFTGEEVEALERYMEENLAKIKKMAAGVRLLDAFIKDDNK